ncbi:MAG: hypothetical protein KDD66_07345 [Bdellovibrionales bacterium]|nr:hypothetical protein [Bdellovibrionales bacterium]
MNNQAGYRYLHLSLCRKRLQDSDRVHLESIGLECVEDGDEFEAYGIIEDTVQDSMISKLSRIDWVEAVEIGEPPSSV